MIVLVCLLVVAIAGCDVVSRIIVIPINPEVDNAV